MKISMKTQRKLFIVILVPRKIKFLSVFLSKLRSISELFAENVQKSPSSMTKRKLSNGEM